MLPYMGSIWFNENCISFSGNVKDAHASIQRLVETDIAVNQFNNAQIVIYYAKRLKRWMRYESFCYKFYA
jgi:hypothetical protein